MDFCNLLMFPYMGSSMRDIINTDAVIIINVYISGAPINMTFCSTESILISTMMFTAK